MKLISMTDYVLEVNTDEHWTEDFTKCVNYAKFLKQPLELWMFVPCNLVDGVWVVLEKPCGYNNYLEYGSNDFLNINECSGYQQAKERCLFDENFNKETCEILIQYEKIESLVEYSLRLSQTAIKQLGI